MRYRALLPIPDRRPLDVLQVVADEVSAKPRRFSQPRFYHKRDALIASSLVAHQSLWADGAVVMIRVYADTTGGAVLDIDSKSLAKTVVDYGKGAETVQKMASILLLSLGMSATEPQIYSQTRHSDYLINNGAAACRVTWELVDTPFRSAWELLQDCVLGNSSYQLVQIDRSNFKLELRCDGSAELGEVSIRVGLLGSVFGEGVLDCIIEAPALLGTKQLKKRRVREALAVESSIFVRILIEEFARLAQEPGTTGVLNPKASDLSS